MSDFIEKVNEDFDGLSKRVSERMLEIQRQVEEALTEVRLTLQDELREMKSTVIEYDDTVEKLKKKTELLQGKLNEMKRLFEDPL